MAANPWPSEWLRGVLAVAVMQVLAREPTYGYALATELEDAGLGTIKGGTLYPLLTRLETAGYVSVEWRAGDGGPGRKYFALTDTGRAYAREQVDLWSRFADTTTRLLDPSTTGPTS